MSNPVRKPHHGIPRKDVAYILKLTGFGYHKSID